MTIPNFGDIMPFSTIATPGTQIPDLTVVDGFPKGDVPQRIPLRKGMNTISVAWNGPVDLRIMTYDFTISSWKRIGTVPKAAGDALSQITISYPAKTGEFIVLNAYGITTAQSPGCRAGVTVTPIPTDFI
ncbi:hypothetical protein [Corynebacterium phoceense]|uniref:hypothetical protein n=1 Tax=Corynebacterium phoceense TaxID=1686286 RepID=UPI00211CAF7D|nr:hypothetical protein [Corynebacterium phoceense]MCQ9345850.1 hypothetical protein [Corynebacterium phoceense]